MKIKTLNKGPKRSIPWKWIGIISIGVLLIAGIIVGSILLLDKTKAKINFITVKFEDVYTEYDGTEKKIEVTGLPTGAKVSYSPTNTYIEPGDYPIVATIEKNGYNTLKLKATLYIEKYYNVSFHQYTESEEMEEEIDIIKVKEGDSIPYSDFPSIVRYPGLTLSWEFDTDIVDIHSDMHVYLISEINSYKITYHYMDNTTEELEYYYNELPMTLPVDDTADGVFFGWYTSQSHSIDSKITQISSVGNYHLYSYICSETEGINYSYLSDHVEISGYSGENPYLVIPSMKEGLPVTIIQPEAFLENQIIEELYILSDSIIIRNKAFRSCYSLKKLYVKGTILSIEDRAFSNCFYLNQVQIGDGTEELGTYSFSFCTSLEGIVLPDSINLIKEYAFNECSMLTNIYYMGTEEQMDDIEILEGNTRIENATWFIFSLDRPEEFVSNHFWHYVDGEIVIWE